MNGYDSVVTDRGPVTIGIDIARAANSISIVNLLQFQRPLGIDDGSNDVRPLRDLVSEGMWNAGPDDEDVARREFHALGILHRAIHARPSDLPY